MSSTALQMLYLRLTRDRRWRSLALIPASANVEIEPHAMALAELIRDGNTGRVALVQVGPPGQRLPPTPDQTAGSDTATNIKGIDIVHEPREVRYDAHKCDRYFDALRAESHGPGVCGLCLYVCPHGRQ